MYLVCVLRFFNLKKNKQKSYIYSVPVQVIFTCQIIVVIVDKWHLGHFGHEGALVKGVGNESRA